MSITVTEIVKPVVPAITLDIVREKQRASAYLKAKDAAKEFQMLDGQVAANSISQLAKLGIVNRNSNTFKQKCAATSFLPFAIALEKGGIIELIATNPDSMQQLIFCIDFLVQNRKQLAKI